MTKFEMGSARLAGEARRRTPVTRLRKALAAGCAAVMLLMPTSEAFAQSVHCGAIVHAWRRAENARGAVNGYAMHAGAEAAARERMAALRCHVPARQGLAECRAAIRAVEQQARMRRAYEQNVRALGGADRAERLAAQRDELSYEIRQCQQRSAQRGPGRVHDFDESPNPRGPTPEESAAVLIGGLLIGGAIAAGARGRGIGRGPLVMSPGMHRR